MIANPSRLMKWSFVVGSVGIALIVACSSSSTDDAESADGGVGAKPSEGGSSNLGSTSSVNDDSGSSNGSLPSDDGSLDASPSDGSISNVGDSSVDPCALTPATYTVSQTLDPSSSAKCTDLVSSSSVFSNTFPEDAEKPVPSGCTRTEDKSTCTSTTKCYVTQGGYTYNETFIFQAVNGAPTMRVQYIIGTPSSNTYYCNLTRHYKVK